ncbi:NUDIX hydrolase [Acidipila sp. EB88]|uniref:NUDIX domain-containing protein n=1 Tax=Acidipila sp. EB88 TaxID=2305226 RepID=UPI000F5FE66D|nr:NUDIX hydrolase [Acidipila sp. EB88]RRA49073.1 NUDIX hydrolase [Acidipila sp. EB88]
MSIKTLASREVYRNAWMRVREDDIERSNGKRGIYGVVEKDPCAVIIPLAGDTLYLVQQYRYTVQEVCLEFPQGGWEAPDVDIRELAAGELREETGLRAGSLDYLGPMWIAYGFCNQQQHAFLATDLTQGETDFDPEEHDLSLHTVSVAEFEHMLLSGRIKDACTIAAWGLYKVWQQAQAKGRL